MKKKVKIAKFTSWWDKTVDLYPIEIRSIDAWRDEGGWYHNNSFVICREQCKNLLISPDITNRKILQLLRGMAILTKNSKGKVKISDQWPYMEIQNKDTGEPLIQIYFDEENKKEFFVG
jgi:hypothetical protein